MNIQGLNSVTYTQICNSGYLDEEYKQIIIHLLNLGVQPTGSKSTDRAKLHELETHLINVELGENGEGAVDKSKYITFSSLEIDKIRQSLRAKNNFNLEEQNEIPLSEDYVGAEQEALLNYYFLVRKNE